MKDLPHLEKDDWKNKGADFWKDYFDILSEKLFISSEKIPKTAENIFDMSNKIGIKPTARYFNIEPSQVRYYRKKVMSKNEK